MLLPDPMREVPTAFRPLFPAPTAVLSRGSFFCAGMVEGLSSVVASKETN